MRVEAARLIAVSLSILAHGALLGWIGAGGGQALVPPQPMTVALVIEAAPVAAPAATAHSAPDPAVESRIPPPPDPAPPVDAAALSLAPTEAPPVRPVPAPLAKPAPSAPDSVVLIMPAAGGAPAAAPAVQPAPAAPAPTGGAVAALTARPAAPLAGAGNAPPVYPLAARRQGIQGRVILEVAVDTDGRATEVRVERSSGSRLLDDAALRAVRDWRFMPAALGGKPMAARVQVPVTFRLDAPR